LKPEDILNDLFGFCSQFPIDSCDIPLPEYTTTHQLRLNNESKIDNAFISDPMSDINFTSYKIVLDSVYNLSFGVTDDTFFNIGSTNPFEFERSGVIIGFGFNW